MNVHDSFEWVNAGVGAAGLLLTFATIIQATGAKSAAERARLAIFRKNAEDDLSKIAEMGSNLLTAVETEQDGLALHVCRELISNCNHLRERYRGVLGEQGGKLEGTFDRLTAISQGIQAGVPRPDLIVLAQRVVRDLSGVAGAVSRQGGPDV